MIIRMVMADRSIDAEVDDELVALCETKGGRQHAIDFIVTEAAAVLEGFLVETYPVAAS